MAKRDNGNEQDLRVRPGAHSLDPDNPFTGQIPPGKDPCVDGYGNQTDVPPVPPVPPVNPPSYDWSDIPGACPSGMTPLLLDKLFIRALKQHFGNPDNIQNPDLKQYVYPDGPDSKIRIVLNTVWDATQAGQIPAIIVKRGPQQSSRVAIGDRGERVDGSDGEMSFTRTIQGSHRILAVGGTDGTAEALGFEIFGFLTCISPIVRTYVPVLNFEVTGMGEMGLLDEQGRAFAIPIQSVYAYEHGWTVEFVAANLTQVRPEIKASLL